MCLNYSIKSYMFGVLFNNKNVYITVIDIFHARENKIFFCKFFGFLSLLIKFFIMYDQLGHSEKVLKQFHTNEKIHPLTYTVHYLFKF